MLEAPNGGEALLRCERHPGPVHLLVTDVVMPLMSGSEVAKRCSVLRAEMRVMYLSGYAEDFVARRGAHTPGHLLLEKPFTLRALAAKVREVLDSPPSA